MSEWLGESVETKGRWFLDHGFKFEHGGGLYFNNGSGPDVRFCLDLPGKACEAIGDDQLVRLLDEFLQFGCKVTRIDVAVDYHGCPGIISSAHASCVAAELCRARRYEYRESFTGTGLTGRTLYLGRRGSDGSGRFVRVYDKGLETGGKPAGEWERWEAEFSDDCALQVGLALCAAEDWRSVAHSMSLGAVDFREVTGRVELERRPRCRWFSGLLDSRAGVCVRRRRPETSLDTLVDWLHSTTFPRLLQMASDAGESVTELLDDLGLSSVRAREREDLVSLQWQRYVSESGRGPARPGRQPKSEVRTRFRGDGSHMEQTEAMPSHEVRASAQSANRKPASLHSRSASESWYYEGGA